MGALERLGEVFNELMNTVIDAQGFWELLAISNLLCLNTVKFIISVLDWVSTNYVIHYAADNGSDFVINL